MLARSPWKVEGSEGSVGKKFEAAQAQIRDIAERKMTDLNANDLDQAAKIIEGTARSMGVEVA